jgi:cytochrome o ubiquinol oxidase subunit 2
VEVTGRNRLWLAGIILVGLLGLAGNYLLHAHIAVLNPRGPIAAQEKQLIITTLLLGLIIVIPVFGMTFWFSWKYRESNTKATYRPNWDHSRRLETVWWLVPSVIIGVLAVIAWRSSHQLDPFRPLATGAKPLTIQVVALDWKWLFIYPQQNLATINYAQIPVDTPVNFELTSDAPMNSFWVPQLGGQIYAMPGMSTQLHLMADKQGSYPGSSANISGQGFSGMHFMINAVEEPQFQQWVNSSRKTAGPELDLEHYNQLALPSQNLPPQTFPSAEKGLYDSIVMKFMVPDGRTEVTP